ncbi:MAG: tRNA (guanosine(37)-N1)-methyltransferase TrmD [Lachnospiraceae bacterium]|nr:tRNA (guanosine(37)-N1)-methyltransferase TrmD [Lachnospiraceae bacterium]
MHFHVLTLFPEMIVSGMNNSITKRAVEKDLIRIDAIDIRAYTADKKHNKVDDYPYGGGAGMVMGPQPVYDCVQDVKKDLPADTPVVYLNPQGRVFNQTIAQELAAHSDIIFLCGHYEGIDERALELCVTDHISVGDYVLTGGELPAMILMDCISRLVPGVLGNDTSADVESFHDNLLEYPQYTRPEEFMGMRVPDVLLSGHHLNIETWRRQQSIRRTLERRPDLLAQANLTPKEQKYLKSLLDAAEKKENEEET